MQQFLKCIIMTSLQKRFIVVLNSRFVEVTENYNKAAKTLIIGSFDRHDGLH